VDTAFLILSLLLTSALNFYESPRHILGSDFWGSRFMACFSSRNLFHYHDVRLQRSISPVLSSLIVLALNSGYAITRLSVSIQCSTVTSNLGI